MMDSLESLLALINIPENCKDAVKLMDLKVPSFVKLLRRILKKLEKGEMYVEKPLPQLMPDGSEVSSIFLLVGLKESKCGDMLFARFPNGEGENDIYQLPFIRLGVQRSDETEKKPFNSDEANQSTLEKTLQLFETKLERIDCAVKNLVENIINNPQRPTLRKSTPAPSINGVKSSNPVPNLVTKTNVSVPKITPSKQPVTKSKTDKTKNLAATPIVRVATPRRLDKTIDRVLSYVYNGEDLDIGDAFRERLINSKPVVVPISNSPSPSPKLTGTKRLHSQVSIESSPSISKLFNPVQSTECVSKKVKR